MVGMATKCRCLYTNCPDGSVNNTCLLQPGGYCFSSVKVIYDDIGKLTQEVGFGCFPPDVEGLLQCKGGLSNHDVPTNVTCCQSGDFCNLRNIPTLDPAKVKEVINYFEPGFCSSPFCWISALTILIIVVFVGLIFLISFRRFKQKKDDKFSKNFSESDDSMDKTNYSFRSNSCKPLLPVPQLDSKFGVYPNFITPKPPSAYTQMGSNSWKSDSSSFGAPPFKYCTLNNSQSSHNDSNLGFNPYRNLSSTTSNTTSSMTSELTQQTTLSSQKPSSINSLPPVNEYSVSSGSGSGIPHLVQKTLAREIQLMELIGKGRYGNVYRGTCKGDNVAVKIFFSRDEASWRREIEIYTTVIMRQENILGFFGADVTSQNGCTEMWLVTEFHQMGSLYDYLYVNPITIPQMMKLMKSIIDGISHLHTEVIGTLGKPAIAHRDIKSKNILMKDDYTCCIADFGLAVTKIQTNHINIAQNHRVGTKRYMAPEVLDETMQSDIFESYRAADIYSLALVFWELYNRVEMNGETNEYMVPFQDDVPNDPSFDDMLEVVCVHKIRPLFKERLEEGKFSSLLASIRFLITECWAHNPSSRMSSLYIKKKLMNLLDLNPN